MDFEGGEFPFTEMLPLDELPEGWEKDGEFFFHGNPEMPFHGEEGLPHFFDLSELPEGVDGAVIISEVMEDTPAAEAGLQPGDLIIAIDGEPVIEIEAFVAALQSHQPGDEVTLTIIRAGEETEVAVTLTEHPDNPEHGFLGVLAGTLMLMENLELPEGFDQEFELELPGVPGGDA
jgi:membrane-associated protease RseP (regulator of RpoE activity)